MRDSVAEPTEIQPTQPPSRTHATSSSTRRLGEWLEQQTGFLLRHWLDEVRHRASLDAEMEQLLKRFLELLTRLLPQAVGQHRAQVAPLWRQAAELYGSLGAQRGLAAGEIVEEFQILREAVLRLLFQAPPGRYGAAFSLADALRLNRFLDSGVMHASIGHTDALFFALFQGSGVPKVPTTQLVTEVEEQLQAIEEELSADAH